MHVKRARSIRHPGVRASLAACSLMLVTACTAIAPRADGRQPAAASYRIWDAAAERFVTLPEMAQRLADADVVLFGEQHDDATAHQVQRELLELLTRQRDAVVLGMEMFERDVQPVLDDYLADRIAEEEFLASSRPWRNYSRSYRPLVEFARARELPVIASNAPRGLAAAVAASGSDVLRAIPASHSDWVADELRCPRDAYYARFVETMQRHPHGGAHHGASSEATVEQFYQAQCLKDETMAESIAEALRQHPGALVLHVHGAFHSDYQHGIAPRVERRAPAAVVRTISTVSAAAARGEEPVAHADRADFILFTGTRAAAGAR
jgi:uncharacterized iron-regulated protein